MSAISDVVMGDNNYYEARARDVNLESITSEHNALILEKLRNNDDSFKEMGIVGADYEDWIDEDDFEVEQGDNVGWLGHFIGKSTRLESLFLHHLPGDDSFRQGLAQNKSIQQLYIYTDLRKAGFQSLAPFLQNTNTLEEITFYLSMNSLESAYSIALLMSQCQIRSLKKLVLDDNDMSGEEFEVIARSLRAQPQLEELVLSTISRQGAPFDQRGYAALGATMKNWTSPKLQKLRIIYGSDLDDDGLLALVEGMANCVNLKHLNLSRNDQITEVGLKALSSLFRSKKFCLQALDVSDVGIDNEGMVTLASGLASIQSLESLNLTGNSIGDDGLEALAVGLSKNKNLESLNLSINGGSFSAIGLRCLSDVIPTALTLKGLDVSGNAINDEGLQALAVGLRKLCTLERLDLSSNAIGCEGLRALVATDISSLRSLDLSSNAINDEALGVFVEGIENFVNLERLNLLHNNLITSSGLAVFAPIFHRKSCSLKEIDLHPTNIDDSEAKAFAEGLVGNGSLERLLFGYTNLTAVGWSAFSTLLCDTSSVNNTYLSNHSLKEIGSRYLVSNRVRDRFPSSFERYLKLNRQNEYDVPICKILMSHSDLDMTPFLQWKLKILPFVLAWFERAQSCCAYLEESIASFKRRELSAMYQFIHGLPLLVASSVYKQMGTDARSKKRKFDQCDK